MMPFSWRRNLWLPALWAALPRVGDGVDGAAGWGGGVVPMPATASVSPGLGNCQ